MSSFCLEAVLQVLAENIDERVSPLGIANRTDFFFSWKQDSRITFTAQNIKFLYELFLSLERLFRACQVSQFNYEPKQNDARLKEDSS